jgi:DNA-binding MarR family transcriptional regulator
LVGGNPGLRQAQLASLMDMERPNLVAIIDELQNRGLLTRDRSPNDGRAYALHLTPQGHDLRTRATRAVEQHEERLTDGLRDADRPLIDAALARIRRNAESR